MVMHLITEGFTATVSSGDSFLEFASSAKQFCANHAPNVACQRGRNQPCQFASIRGLLSGVQIRLLTPFFCIRSCGEKYDTVSNWMVSMVKYSPPSI
jgi:hypothetical protein